MSPSRWHTSSASKNLQSVSRGEIDWKSNNIPEIRSSESSVVLLAADVDATDRGAL